MVVVVGGETHQRQRGRVQRRRRVEQPGGLAQPQKMATGGTIRVALAKNPVKNVSYDSRSMDQRILEIAKQHGIHVHADPDLAALLTKLDPDQPIPENLYRAVAEILAYIYSLRARPVEAR